MGALTGIREVTLLAVFLRIFSSILIGGLIGIERGMKHRPAGMRTYMVVCLGACLIMLTNQYIFQIFGTGDPVRMGAQVISGIGFLGAGTIVVTRRNQIKGLTTAAGLWACAGVGLALGIGFYEAAIAGGLAVFSVMTLLQRLDNRMHSKTRALDVYVELSKDCPLGDFLRNVRGLGIEVRNTQRELDTDENVQAYITTLQLQKRTKHQTIVQNLREIPGVVYLDEM